jgi:hypothetical protein
MTTSEINGLIIIDCWEPDSLFSQATKQNKKNTRAKNNFFVSLADNLKSFSFDGIINANTHNIQTAKPIERYLSTCSTVFSLSTQRDFFELRRLKHWKNINHWLVVGTTWRICVHLNDMGLVNFAASSWIDPKLNFYGASWGFLKHHNKTMTAEDFANDYLEWTAFEHLFKLRAIPTPKTPVLNPTVAIRNKYVDETPY